jgi:hypothetical protein
MMRAVQENASPIVLSTTASNDVEDNITLIFSNALDANAATNVFRYTVTINGVEAAVENVTLRNKSVVTLGLGEYAINAGDRVVVTYDLLDAQGKAIKGTAAITVG